MAISSKLTCVKIDKFKVSLKIFTIMQKIYIVFVYDMEQQLTYHHGRAFKTREEAVRYRDFCNKQYDVMNINKVAHVETLDIID